jgi:hypothetical protein
VEVVKMVKFICGEKGSGKTKKLIEMSNADIKAGNGNIVFVAIDHNHIFSLDYLVRLINAMEFNIEDIESFYGFLCGILSMDYDLDKVYVDGIYKLIKIEKKDIDYLIEKLNLLSEKFGVDFYIGLGVGSDYKLKQIPYKSSEYIIEVAGD